MLGRYGIDAPGVVGAVLGTAAGGGLLTLAAWGLRRHRGQYANSPLVTLENARREGVLPRVALLSSDARSLPLATEAFDVVVSSLTLHNLPDAQAWRMAVRETYRVLKPGGGWRYSISLMSTTTSKPSIGAGRKPSQFQGRIFYSPSPGGSCRP